MSVVGCDFGTINTVIAVARNRGVDVVSKAIFVRSLALLFNMSQSWPTNGPCLPDQHMSNIDLRAGLHPLLSGLSLSHRKTNKCL